jgi:hypothetical protein
MTNRISGKFLATVAVSAGSVGMGAHGAAAADFRTAPQSWSSMTVSIEGGILQNRNQDDENDKLGGNNGDNAYGAISLTKNYAPDLDWRFGGSAHFGESNHQSFTIDVPGTLLNYSTSSKFDFQTIDFDLGKHLRANTGTDIRLFAGVRALRASERIGFNWEFNDPDEIDAGDKIASSGDKVGTSTFYGIGPRVGVDVTHPLGATWGLMGSVSGAAIYGRRKEDISLSGTTTALADPLPGPDVVTPFSESSHSTSWGVVGNLNVKAGVQWMPWQNTVLTAGYQFDYWYKLRSFASDNDETFHGPFLKLDVKY